MGVWSLEYEAASLRWKGHAMPLADRAVNVIDVLLNRGVGVRPTIFITHSLGGLLVKQILFASRTSGLRQLAPIAQVTRGVVFFGTPHSGSDMANWVIAFRNLFLPNISIEELRHHAGSLAQLNDWYRNNAEAMDVATRVYSESWEVKGLVVVVDKQSADPSLAGVPVIPLDRDHISLCKLAAKDHCYLGVLAFIRERLGLGGPANDPEIDEEQMKGNALKILQTRLPAYYKVIKDDYRINFTALLRSTKPDDLLFAIEIAFPDDGAIYHVMRKLAFSTDWLHFGGKETLTPMVIAIVTEMNPRSVEEALRFLREHLNHPTQFGRLIVRIVTVNRFHVLSANEIDILLDSAQKLWLFA